MPVRLADEATDSVGPYSRLSASQVNTYRSCPRLWYYEKVLRFKMPQIPVLFVGRAVEEAVCRVLRESPALIVHAAPTTALDPSPLDEEGMPDRNTTAIWPSSRLLPLPVDRQPSSKDELLDWAMARCELHLPPALARVRLEWEKDERKAGDWSSVDVARCVEMTKAALRFHLEEVSRCYDENGGPSLESWRNGVRENWPAPDGYGFEHLKGHPLAGNGPISWVEAWEVTRPWFVDPDAAKFSLNAIHPDHWFQGEYDLVYRWDGEVNIVDLKASLGAGDRSGNYVEQLKMYAMLWHLTHAGESMVSALEIWYLGHPSIKTVEPPSLDEIEAMEAELHSLWEELKQEVPSRDACPPEPSPMRGFSPGGVSVAPPNMSRCRSCDWQKMCPGGSGSDETGIAPQIQLAGTHQKVSIEPIGDLSPRATIRGELFTVGTSIQGKAPKMIVQQGTLFATIQVNSDQHSDGGRTWPEGLVKGQEVLIEQAVFTTNWKHEIVLKIDPFSRIQVIEPGHGEQGEDLLAFNAKWNVGGRVVYTYEKSGVSRNGKTWRRKGLMLLDHSGAMKIEGWADDWNGQYDMLEVGDGVVIANIGLDAWASEVRGDHTRQSRLYIVERVDRSSTA